MDPLYAKLRHDSHMIQQIFDRLVEYDTATNKLKPSLAHFWESKDGMDWYFYLRKGIYFHHGKALTSKDVKQTFQRLRVKRDFYDQIEWIKTPSPMLVNIRLKEINWLFPRYLAKVYASIIPLDVVEEVGEKQQKKPIGSGPFQLSIHDKHKLRLDVFSDYYATRPWIDRVEIIKTPKIYQSEIDAPFLLDAPDGTWKKIDIIEEGAEFILFNDQSEICHNYEMRSVIAQCIERSYFQLGNSRKIPAYSFLAERSLAISNSTERMKKNIHSSLSRQEALSKALPYLKFHRPLRIAAQQIRSDVNHLPEAEEVQRQLNQYDISSTIHILPVERFYNEINQYDVFVGGVMLGEDRLLSLISILKGGSISISQCIHNPELRKGVDKTLHSIQQLEQESKNWELYMELEDALINQYYIYFLNHRKQWVYEPSEHQYGFLELDRNGRVDYRKIWKRG